MNQPIEMRGAEQLGSAPLASDTKRPGTMTLPSHPILTRVLPTMSNFSIMPETNKHYDTNIQHLAALRIDRPHKFRNTSIICTIGPKTNTPEALAKLRQAGMNIVRMNFSHGTHEYHGSIIDNTRKSYDVLPGRKVAIALDTKGPEIRTGTLAEPEVTYEQDQEFILTTDESRKNNGDKQTLYCDYKELCLSVQVGQKIFVADGSLTLIVLEKDPASVFLKVKAFNTAKIGSKKNMNLPMCEIHLPALSEQDKKDLEFGVERDIDMVFASFVRKAADVREIRKVLGEKGKHIKIISKIENHEGIENYESILAESDGIMVARGDLGMEIAPSKIFLAQKMMIARANLVGKPIICATQMLESMIKNPRPTRAEVTDVANAVLDGADCVMLSGETANGDFPNECVTMMHDICCEAEQAVWNDRLFHELVKLTPQPTPTTETIAAAAVNASFQQPNMAAIVVLSTSGSSAAAVSKYRPRCPIICVTRSERTARACHLNRGVISVFYPEPPCADDAKWQDDVDARMRYGVKTARDMGLMACAPHETVLLIQGWGRGSGRTNAMRIISASEML